MSGLISISESNIKLGSIPSVSLVPGRDCGNCSKCIGPCYARKIARLRPNVAASWERNSGVARSSQREYFKQIEAYLSRFNSPRYFRFHVGGDILNQRYVRNMARLARRLPHIGFLAFTKMHELNYTGLPDNLVIIASMWPGLDIPTNVESMPKAWMQDGTETRVPADAIDCPGLCDACGMCWNLPKLGRDVVFHEH